MTEKEQADVALSRKASGLCAVLPLNSELDIGEKECTFERNVCLIVSLLPFFKGIIIGDLDLTQDLRYVPISKIIGNVNAI